MSHSNSCCCFTAWGDWAILTNTFHDTLAWIQFDCGVLLNVNALCLSLLSFSAFTSGWIIRSQCVSLHRLLFLLCQAGALPGLSLRFVNFCLVHLETNITEYIKWKTALGFFCIHKRVSCCSHSVIFKRTCPGDCNLLCKIKWRYYGKRSESQVSADNQIYHTYSIYFLSPCETPVCLFDTCRLW